MKAPYKKDAFGERVEWVEKVRPRKETFFKSTDFKTFALLPDEMKFKRNTGLAYAACIICFILLAWAGFEFVSLFNDRPDYNLPAVKILTFLAVIIIEGLIIKVAIDDFRSSGVRLVITKEHFIYKDQKTEWTNVKGIYAVYRRSRSIYLNTLRIKTYNKKIVEIYISDINIREEYVPGVFSIYKTYYDCHSK